MEDRSYWSLALFAVLCLAAGTLVYLAGRPVGAAYLLPVGWYRGAALPWLSGMLGQSLPSFLHALAFSLLTAACLAPWRYAAAASCGLWLVVGSVFEIAQADGIATAVAARLPDVFSHWPVLDHVGPYLLNGRMDPMDLVFTAAGCALAFALLQRRART